MKNLAQTVVEKLKEKHLKVSAAESCTGGLVAAEITSVSGASEVISYSVVTYSDEVKIKKLGVKEATVRQFGAVSEQTAGEMAQRVREESDADIGVSVTGVAGPAPSEGKPVGLVYVGVSDKSRTNVLKLDLKGDRQEIRRAAAQKALEAILQTAQSL